MTTRILRAALALVLATAMSGCWLMGKKSESMIGKDRDALFETWGPPAQAKTDKAGNEAWIYVEEDSSTSQGGLRMPSLNEMNAVLGEVASGKLSHSNGRWNSTVVNVSQRMHIFWFDKKGKIIKAYTVEPR